MTAAWIAPAAVLLAAALALASRRLLRDRRSDRASVVHLDDATSLDSQGAVTSVQKADILIDAEDLEAIWTPAHLERLARTYWRFLTRVTLGLIRIHYTEDSRSVVLIARPFRLLTFQAPEYEMDTLHGLVRWRIERGLLVSKVGRGGRGHLQIEVRRDAPAAEPGGRVRLHVEVEVANFYPSIAHGISRRIYNVTQSRIHVIVTYAFLRSLTRLDLAESRVGSLLPR